MSKVPALAAPEAPRRVAVVASAFTFESFKIGALAEALASVNKPTALLPVVILSRAIFKRHIVYVWRIQVASAIGGGKGPGAV